MMELGLDGSFTNGRVVPVDWFQRRYADGYRVWAQCVWTGGLAGNDGIKLVAAGNLLNAAAGGLKVVAYANASPPTWWSLPIQMQHIKENCGAAWPVVQHFPVDVEIAGTTYARVVELANAFKAESKNPIEVLYSARWFWTSANLLGDPLAAAWRRWLLWNANYDFNRDVDFGSARYGPWSLQDLVAEQWQGTTRLDGVDVDLNVFDVARLFPAPPAPPVSPPPAPPVPTPVPPAPKEEPHMASTEFNALSALIAKQTTAINALTARVARLEAARPPAPKPPAPRPPAPPAMQYHTVVGGETAGGIAATFGITLALLATLNPGKPRSGNWNTIYPGEVFRVK